MQKPNVSSLPDRVTTETDAPITGPAESLPAPEQTVSPHGTRLLAATLSATVWEPLLILTGDLQVLSASPAFYETFQLTPEAVEGQYLYALGSGSWNIPALRMLFEQVASAADACHHVEVSHEFPAVGHKTLLLNVRHVAVDPRQGPLIIVAIEDMSARQHAEAQRKAGEDRARFLAEASTLLASSLDLPIVLDVITRLAVPHIADWCAVDLLNDQDVFDIVAIAHTDPQKVNLVKAYRDANPIDMSASFGLPEIVRTKQSEFIPLITDDMLVALSRTDSDLAIVRRLGMTSVLSVPLLVRGAAIGAITFVTSESTKRLTEADLAMAEGLARHAALAIENARLFARVKQELAEREKAEVKAKLVRDQLYNLFMQAPAFIAVLSGPDHVFELANPLMIHLLGKDRDIIGKPVIEAVAEVAEQGFIALLDRVYATGNPFFGTEVPVQLNRHGNGELEAIYLNFVYQPYKDAQGNVQGILVHAVDVTEHVVARRQVEEIAALNKTMTDNATTGLFIMNEQQRCTFMNPAAEKLTGFTFAEVQSLDRPLHDIIHHTRPDGTHYPLSECPIDRALPTKNQEKGEDVFVHKDGSFYPVAFTASPILKDGAPVGTVIEVRDTTEEQRIQREQARLVSIIENSSDFIGFASPTGQILYMNEAGQQLIGLDAVADMRSLTIPDFFFPADRAFSEQVILPMAREQGRWEGEFRFRHAKTGNAIPVWYTIFVLRDHASGQLLGFGTVTRDITERKRAEEALRYQSQLTKTITDNAASCLFMLDSRGYPTFMNPAAEAVTGYTLHEIADKPFHDSMHHHYPGGHAYPMDECPIHQASATLEPLKNHEDVFIRKDGGFFPVSLSLMPLEQDGSIVGAVLEFQDITERKQLEQRRDQFLSVASHELKTPITTIKGFCELLLKRADQHGASEREMRALDAMNKQADRLTRLVNDMLDVPRLMMDTFELSFEAVDVEAFLQAIVEQWQMVYTSHRFILEATTPCIVEADPDRLQQVVLNLLSNAVQHAPAMSTITIRLTTEDDRVTVAIQDAGSGIPKEKQPSLFERFYQAQERPARGLGLGLYIAKAIIERHHGTIAVESEVGHGSTFFFSLPCKR